MVPIFTEQALKQFVVCLYDSGVNLKQSAILILGKLLHLLHDVGPIFFKIIDTIITDKNESYPLYGLIDDVVNWAQLKKVIDVETANLIEKEIATTRTTIACKSEESFLKELIKLLIEHHAFIFYNDAQVLLFPEHDLLAELKEAVLSEKIRAYSSLNEQHFYLHITTLLKWLMQKGYVSEPFTEAFKKIKVELIKESMLPYDGRFNSLRKLIQQGADRDDLLYEALHEKPLYWKYPKDCKCRRNMDNRCICNKGVRWEESKSWVKHNITATQRLDGFGQLKKNENDDTFGCQFGGLTIDMLRHNKLPKTSINHYQIELVPTEEEIIYGLQPCVKVSQRELMTAIADDKIGFLEDDVQSLARKPPEIISQKMSTTEIQEPIFSKNDDLYEITYQNKTIQLPCSVGLNRLAYLIQNPNIKISPLELAQKFNRSNYDSQIEQNSEGTVDLAEQGINSDAFWSDDPVNDKQAQREYKNKATQLTNEIKVLKEKEDEAKAKGDSAQAGTFKEQQLDKAQKLITLQQFIKKDQNHKGKSRHHKTGEEKARSAVQQSIKDAIDKITQKHIELGTHLGNTVETGSKCLYLLQSS